MAFARSSLGLLFLACAHIILVASQRLYLYEDQPNNQPQKDVVRSASDICNQEGGSLWKCAPIKSCPRAQQMLKQGRRPQLCNFSNRGSDAVVCCEPDDVTTPPTPGAKSLQKCEDYSKFVFTVLPDLFGDGNGEKTDNCAANVEPLVVNGKNAEPREYPHMALIGYGAKPDVQWLCGGSLISERFVLSAAHCTNASGDRGLASWARLGEYKIKTSLDEVSGLAQVDDYRIAERINHPGFEAGNVLYDDIALYRLDQDVRFNEFIRPACLHTTHTFAKTYAIATGWGRTEWGGEQSEILQKGNLTIVPRKNCSDAWQITLRILYNNTEGIRDASMMCAGDIQNGVDTCQGDSGGPLQLRLKSPYCMYSIIGVTSLGSKCGGNTPGIYSRVSHYLPWIEKIVWP